MKFTKKILEEQDHCYAVNVMQADGEPYVFFAAENRGGCFACADYVNDCRGCDVASKEMAMKFMQRIPAIRDMLTEDARAAYVKAWFQVVNWYEAERRYQAALLEIALQGRHPS